MRGGAGRGGRIGCGREEEGGRKEEKGREVKRREGKGGVL